MKNNACTFIASNLTDFSFGYDSTDPKCIALKLQLAQYINDMYMGGIKNFYSVCQEGADLWAAEIVTYIMRGDSEVTLCCIIPYEEQAAKWHPDTRELYYRVLEQATEVRLVSTSYTDTALACARYEALDCCENVFAVVKEGRENHFVKYGVNRGKNVRVI
ncbi:MAG: DUF1273 domain-containing protein [Firmicutes bacterium]|nr:DUF1273 domain-containing protein [[Eubacterium] siraeum]MCM1487061.1 DUF1273 domain-containing protein [Bacillota bacterium]